MIDMGMSSMRHPLVFQSGAPWPYNQPQTVKREPMDEDKNDSGVDFHSSSPGSDHSTQYSPHPSNFIIPQSYNPLTPPLISPAPAKDLDATLTPSDHLHSLQQSLEKSGLFSPKPASEQDEDHDDPKAPKSGGRTKLFKCKQCDHIAGTKLDFWDHQKTHIREDKRLSCPKCPFITEYKHHLEYHLRNHAGDKPFKCDKCSYDCVNKSMLNSHMKSHSNIYRYQCGKCTYESKYCHSFKLHLRRNPEHFPKVLLDEEGNPCPDLIIDVYGRRRGPKIKHLKAKQLGKEEEAPPGQQEALPFGLNFMGGEQGQLPFGGYPFFPNAQILQNFQQMLRERQALAAAMTSPEGEEEEEDVLDLSKPMEQKSRRKGPAFKLNAMNVEEEEDDDDEEDVGTTMFSNVEVVHQEGKDKEVVKNNNSGEDNTCQYCSINFGDPVLYTMHMGYHGFQNPFTCNMCGVECADKVGFFLHIARTSH